MRFINKNSIEDSGWWDTIEGTAGADMIEIGFGNDTVYARGGDDAIWDKDGAYVEDVWLGSDDKIYAGGGNDLIFAGWGADTIDGGSGHDTLDYRYSRTGVIVDLRNGTGLGGNDSASKGDKITSIETVAGSHHNDILFSSASQNLDGGDGNDTLTGGTGSSELRGGAGDDYIIVKSFSNVVNGGDGFDTADYHGLGQGIALGSSASQAQANAIGARRATETQVEKVVGTAFADYIHLGAFSNDTKKINGMGGNDTLNGGGGNDVLNGGTGNDMIHGGNGKDVIHGDSGNDTLHGGYGDNQMFGDAGNDTLFDGANTDVMNGGTGNDRLVSSFGRDQLTGGTGADTFVFDNFAQYCANATITDFNRADDVIDLSGIDAVVEVTGNQSFVFDRTGSGDIGTVHSEIVGNKTIITTVVDISHGYVADMTITLEGRHVLNASDFIL
ncbi:calcium-binding protein [Pararhizobium antarcticum]|nr:calcium-binding protein [Pararhizobium antarcticum]